MSSTVTTCPKNNYQAQLEEKLRLHNVHHQPVKETLENRRTHETPIHMIPAQRAS